MEHAFTPKFVAMRYGVGPVSASMGFVGNYGQGFAFGSDLVGEGECSIETTQN
jgi:hypothetical protein